MLDNNIDPSNFQWIRNPEQKGERLFSFDGKKIYNLFRDYPHELSAEEREIFDELNPFWVDFFSDRVD